MTFRKGSENQQQQNRYPFLSLVGFFLFRIVIFLWSNSLNKKVFKEHQSNLQAINRCCDKNIYIHLLVLLCQPVLFSSFYPLLSSWWAEILTQSQYFFLYSDGKFRLYVWSNAIYSICSVNYAKTGITETLRKSRENWCNNTLVYWEEVVW